MMPRAYQGYQDYQDYQDYRRDYQDYYQDYNQDYNAYQDYQHYHQNDRVNTEPQHPGEWLTTDKHRLCKLPSCNNQVARHKDGKGQHFWSKWYCNDHTCGLGLYYCFRLKRTGAAWCLQHSTCYAPDCHVKMTTADKDRLMKKVPTYGQFPWFCCERHRCQYPGHGKRNCVQPAWYKEDSRYCEGHTKMVEEQIAVATAQTSSHAAPQIARSQCYTHGCHYQRWPSSWYCHRHKCEQCDELAVVDGLCSKHRPQPLCAATGCNNYSVRQAGTEAGGLCSGHKRCAETDCSAITPKHLVFCDAHRCKVAGCASKKYKSLKPQTEYCSLHCCIEEGCNYCVANCQDERYQRCLSHTCIISDCPAKSIMEQGFCKHHSCYVKGCTNGPAAGHLYCFSHECQDVSCLSYCKEHKGYCLDHGCARETCSKPNGDPDYPTLCTSHARKMVRREAVAEGRKSMEGAVEAERIRSAHLENQIEEILSSQPPSPRSSSRRRDKSKKERHDKKKADKKRREKAVEEPLREKDRDYVARMHLRGGRYGDRLDPRDFMYSSEPWLSSSSHEYLGEFRYVTSPYARGYTR